MADERKRSRWGTLSAATLAIAALYVLSYAPALRWYAGTTAQQAHEAMPNGKLPYYQPVEWLIDKSYKQIWGPLMWWAGLWDVRYVVHENLMDRAHERSW